jgi:hypothetical protein
MKKQTIVLILIFILALGFRLYFAFQIPALDHEAYFNLRQIAEISKTGQPIFQDPLSYGGRTVVFTPFFQYLLALFNLIMPLALTLKLIPNILASSIVIINYLIAKKMTKDINASLFCAFISAFIPIYISETFNSASIYSLVIPLTFLSIYFLMDINKKRFISYFLITAILLVILHPSSFLLIVGLLAYLLMTKLEYLKQERAEIEAIMFLTFFSIWINFILYKKAFLSHGPFLIWQNIPPEIISFYFAHTNIIEAVIKIGLIPIILGAYIIYRYVFREKNKEIYTLIGLALACFFLLWPRLLQPGIAFMFLGIILTILFAQGYKLFFDYLKKTRIASYKNLFILLFVIIFIISSIIPSIYFTNQKIEQAPTQNDINALLWLKTNTNKEDMVVASLKEGYMITAIAERKNLMDSDFLLIPNSAQRFQDLRTIYSSNYKTEAIPLLNKYNVKYILLSDSAKSEFSIETLRYVDEECFKLVFDNQTKIYESLCKIEEI